MTLTILTLIAIPVAGIAWLLRRLISLRLAIALYRLANFLDRFSDRLADVASLIIDRHRRYLRGRA